ncbi:MAG: hypothetical protein HYS86_00695 [Candidatus Chisholmbacteria bacterium]|nr:hypothetical protein [Candidatus Chisholmbacteria bacterium]
MRRREKKTTLPLLVLTCLSFGGLGFLLWQVDPLVVRDFIWAGVYVPFFGVFFLAWFFLITLVLNNSRRGLLYALVLTVILILRLVRLGNVVNVALLLALTVAIDFYFQSR